MFIRRKQYSTGHTCYVVVRSVRVGGKPRHQTVIGLGRFPTINEAIIEEEKQASLCIDAIRRHEQFQVRYYRRRKYFARQIAQYQSRLLRHQTRIETLRSVQTGFANGIVLGTTKPKDTKDTANSSAASPAGGASAVNPQEVRP